ncbi:MAG: hypothetical protein K8S97_08620 [Anaerolineae bacterium]|nr:hypothetical protein [Anaerolineae bacterium]
MRQRLMHVFVLLVLLLGLGGQYIIVRPDYDLVVAITSDPQRANYEELAGLVRGYILPAIRHGERDAVEDGE